jgi:hypothetical protein
LFSLEKGIAILPRGPFDSTACYEVRVSALEATIVGLQERLSDTLSALRAAEGARDRAVMALDLERLR